MSFLSPDVRQIILIITSLFLTCLVCIVLIPALILVLSAAVIKGTTRNVYSFIYFLLLGII
jgi:hypothetical protein